MKPKIKFLPSRRESDPEAWRDWNKLYEGQGIDWTQFTEDDVFIESVLKIPERWKELHEEYLRTNLTREQYIERCRRNKESLERFLKEHVINRAEKKPGYLDKEYSGTLPALIEYIQGFIDDYDKEIERESKLLPQKEPLEIQSGESNPLQEVGRIENSIIDLPFTNLPDVAVYKADEEQKTGVQLTDEEFCRRYTYKHGKKINPGSLKAARNGTALYIKRNARDIISNRQGKER